MNAKQIKGKRVRYIAASDVEFAAKRMGEITANLESLYQQMKGDGFAGRICIDGGDMIADVVRDAFKWMDRMRRVYQLESLDTTMSYPLTPDGSPLPEAKPAAKPRAKK